jgi:hypothetical protein
MARWEDIALADLMKQGWWRGEKVKRIKKVKPTVACDLCLDWHQQGKHRYVVWDLGEDGVSRGDGKPKATLKEAVKLAIDRASRGPLDQVISLGRDPSRKGFKILQRYRARVYE